MAIRINNIRISIDEDPAKLRNISANKLRIGVNDINDFNIVKESVDARRKGRIDIIYSVELSIGSNESSIVESLNDNDVRYIEPVSRWNIEFGHKKLNHRPIIIGTGPAGLFAGLILARNGYKPLIFERGRSVEERSDIVQKFWKTGVFDPECNVQFGEGGAGTFSDGKLTTRIRDERCFLVLDAFAKNGAPSDIVYSYMPHIGTDILKRVVSNIRKEIVELGGEVYFSSKLTDIKTEAGVLSGITINDNLNIDCEALILAVGHSARDTYEMLLRRGALMSPKPFAVGFRIEHRQRMIDEAQYGKFAGHPRLHAADYRLTYHSRKYDRACYTFCMCPGGYVVAAASEEKRVVTNGMSEHGRDAENANSALVCSVTPDDFKGSSPLSGIEFQRRLEEAAYDAGGGNYMAPVQRVDDFFSGRVTQKLGGVKPSYTRGYNFADLNKIMPEVFCAVIKEGIQSFDRKIKGFSEGILTGVETRTSAPVRIERNESCESAGICGLYPAGEGAGYAGGIVTAAVDGLRVAEEIMKIYAPIV